MNDREPSERNPKQPSSQESYNTFTDTVTGPNVRLKDNVFQGLCVLAGMILGVGIGALVALQYAFSVLVGCLVGGAGGLLLSVLASGFILMIYRAIKHD